MATQTIALGTPEVAVGVLIRFELSPPLPLLDAELIEGGGSGYLKGITLFTDGLTLLEVNPSDIDAVGGIGPNMVAAWESNLEALTFSVPGLSDLVVPGPTATGSVPSDSDEPYQWTPSNGVAVGTWVASVLSSHNVSVVFATNGAPPIANVAPSFADSSGDAQAWDQNTAITPITVPAAAGNPTPAYAASGFLPAGIAFDTGTRVISGTPTVPGSGTITIRATNSEGSTDWTVAYTTAAVATSVPSFPTGLSATATFSTVSLAWNDPGDSTITSYQILRLDVTGGGSFEVAHDSVPAGTSYDDSSNIVPENAYRYRIKARNAVGLSDQSSFFNITTPAAPVNLTAPSFADSSGDAQNWTQGQAITPLTVPTASGNPTPTYAVVGSPPAGISFSPGTRVISGTPTATGSGTITIRATNSEGSADWTVAYTTSAGFTVPSFADDTGGAQNWTQNTAIASITVPAAVGNPTPAYAVVGSPPAGISFNVGSRILSGTPTATGSGTITIRATNSEGSTDWTVAYTTAAAAIDTSWMVIADATPGTTHSHTFTGLVNGTLYEVQVRASNSQGDGPWSGSRQATPSGTAVQSVVFINTLPETIVNVASATPDITVDPPVPDVIVNIPETPAVAVEVFQRPGKPTILTISEAGSHKMRVAWDDPSEGGSHAIEYYDLRLRSGLEWTPIDRLAPDGEHTVRGLANDVEFDFQVRAVSDAGPGPWSDIHSAIPQAARVRSVGLKFMVNWDNRLWGITDFGQLYYTYDFTSGWIESSDIPDHHTPVTAMFIYRDATGEPIIHVMTETGLWVHDLDNERFLLTDVRFPRIPDGGKGSTVWRGDLYIPQGTQVYRYGGGGTAVLSLVGPGREQGVPWPGESKIVKLEGTHNALLAAVQNTESGVPVGTSHIIAYDGVGWQSAWTPGDHEVLNDILVGTIYGEYSVWIGHGEDLSVIDLPRDIINPSHVSEDRRYASSAYAITPWVNANEPELLKVALTIKAEAARLSETETLKIEYALNYDVDTWHTVKFVGTNNADPPVSTTYDVLDSAALGAFFGDYDVGGDPIPRSQGLVSFNLQSDDTGAPVENTSGAKTNGIPFYAIRFRITGVSEDTELSPHLNMVGVEFKRHLEVQWGFQIQVDLSYSERGLDPAELRKELIKVAGSDVLVPFSYVTENGEDVKQYVDVQTSGLVEGGQNQAPVSDVIRMIEL